MKKINYLTLLLTSLLVLAFQGCGKDEKNENDPKFELVQGEWSLESIHEGGRDVTSKYRDINNWIDISSLSIGDNIADYDYPYFQYFIVGFFSKGADADHNEGEWSLRGETIVFDSDNGKYEARINKLDSKDLYLEINDEGTIVEYRFSRYNN